MKWNRKGLVWRLTRMVSLLLLVTTLVICGVYIITVRNTLIERTEEQLGLNLDIMQSNIESSLVDANTILDQLFNVLDLSYFLSVKNTLSEREQEYYIYNLQRHLTYARALYDHKYSNIAIYSSNRQISVEQYLWQYYLDDLMDRPYFKEINDSEQWTVYGKVRTRDLKPATLDTDISSADTANIQVLPIYRKVFSHNPRKLVGVVEIDIEVTRLVNKDDLMKADNSIGHVVLDSGYHVLFDTLSLSEEDNNRIAEAIENDMGNGEVQLSAGGYLLSYRSDSRTGLIVAALSSQSLVFRDAILQVAVIIQVAVLFWLVLVAISFTFVRNALKRLVILDKMMGKVGKGDFEVEIAGDNNEDEISRISQSFNEMTAQLTSVMEEKVQYQQAQKDAELKALQAQINPHFLYNTLDSMRMQCVIDNYDSLGDNLAALSDLFRYSIRWGSSQAPFAMEWENLKNYLEIMKMRYGDDLECELCCGEVPPGIIVPKMLLQPLVENSFNHAFKEKVPPWKLEVKAFVTDDKLWISIKDNGRGIPPERLEYLLDCLKENHSVYDEEHDKDSIGVVNVKQRIDMICKAGSTMRVESTLGEGTTIIIEIVC